MPSILRVLPLVLISPALVLGCGERKADTASADSAVMAENDGDDIAESPAATSTKPDATPADASSQPLTVEVIGRWQKGMAGEMETIRVAAARMKTAGTAEDRLSIVMEVEESATAPAGAQAAGIGEERYRFVRSKLSDVVKYLVPLELEGMDSTTMPQNQRDQFRSERDAYLKQMAWAVPSEVIEALKPRAAELRKQDLELVGARIKGAGFKPSS